MLSSKVKQRRSETCFNCKKKFIWLPYSKTLTCCRVALCLQCQEMLFRNQHRPSTSNSQREACPFCNKVNHVLQRSQTLIIKHSHLPKILKSPLEREEEENKEEEEEVEKVVLVATPASCALCHKLAGVQSCSAKRRCEERFCRQCLQHHERELKLNKLKQQLVSLNSEKEIMTSLIKNVLINVKSLLQCIDKQAQSKIALKEKHVLQNMYELQVCNDNYLADVIRKDHYHQFQSSLTLQHKSTCDEYKHISQHLWHDERQILQNMLSHIQEVEMIMKVQTNSTSASVHDLWNVFDEDSACHPWQEVSVLPSQLSFSCCWCNSDGILASVVNEDMQKRGTQSLQLVNWIRKKTNNWKVKNYSLLLPEQLETGVKLELCPTERRDRLLLWIKNNNCEGVRLHLIDVKNLDKSIVSSRWLPEDCGLPHYDVFQGIVWIPRSGKCALQQLSYPRLALHGVMIPLADCVTKPGAICTTFHLLAVRDDATPFRVHLLNRLNLTVLRTLQIDAIFGQGLTMDGELLIADPSKGLLIWNSAGQLLSVIKSFCLMKNSASSTSATQLRVFECAGRVFVQEECEATGLSVFIAAEHLVDCNGIPQKDVNIVIDPEKKLSTFCLTSI